MQFIDLNAQRKRIDGKIKDAIARVIEGGKYILGPEVTDFENMLAQYIGVRNVIGCANGTDALLLPLLARGIGPGDIIFCPSFTFAATAEVAPLVGAIPFFVDIEEESYNIDPHRLEEAILTVKKEGKLRPKAIITVDLFGLSASYDAISTIAQEHDLFLIEDAAQSIGGRAQGVMCGAFGDVAATSFYPAKPLGCYGDGGAMLTNDDSLAEILRSLIFHGKGETQYDNIRIGLNSRLDTIQAAILIEKLAILEEEMLRRAEIAKRYDAALSDIVFVPHVPQGARSAYAQYTIQAEDRDSLAAYLQEQGIPVMVYYARPLHLQKAYVSFPRPKNGLPVSERLANRVLSLPMHPYLSYEDQDCVIEAVRNFYRR